jgi:hypothetical protein
LIIDVLILLISWCRNINWDSRRACNFTRWTSWFAWASNNLPRFIITSIIRVPIIHSINTLNKKIQTLQVKREFAEEVPKAFCMLSKLYPVDFEGTIPWFLRSWIAECCWFKVIACLKYLSIYASAVSCSSSCKILR